RPRLQPIYDSRGTARCASKILEPKKNRQHRLLSLPAASAAAVRLARPQSRRLSARGKGGAGSPFAADVSGIAKRADRASGGNSRRLFEVLNALHQLRFNLLKSSSVSRYIQRPSI